MQSHRRQMNSLNVHRNWQKFMSTTSLTRMVKFLPLSRRMPHSKKSMTIKEVKKSSTDLIARENKLHTTIAQDLIYSKRYTTQMDLLKKMSNNFVLTLTQLITSTRHLTT